MNNVTIKERRLFTTEETQKIQSNISEIRDFLINEVIPYIMNQITVEFDNYVLTIEKNEIILSSHGVRTRIFLVGNGIQEFDIYFLSEKFWENSFYQLKVNDLYEFLLNWKNKACLKDKLVDYIERRKLEIEILNNFSI